MRHEFVFADVFVGLVNVILCVVGGLVVSEAAEKARRRGAFLEVISQRNVVVQVEAVTVRRSLVLDEIAVVV